MRIIKLENIRLNGELVTEYVCEGCRELVGKDDKVCWQCGENLGQSELVEHYHRGERLTDEEYQRRKPQ